LKKKDQFGSQQRNSIKFMASNNKISIPFIFICFFTISNFFSPLYYFGEKYARIPFILATIAAIAHIIYRVTKGKPIIRFHPSIIVLFFIWLFAVYGTYIGSVDIERSKETLDYLNKEFVLFVLLSQIISNLKELKIYFFVLACCTYGIAYKLTHYPVWNMGRSWLYGTGFGGDPNILTLLFVFSLPLFFATILISNNKPIKVLFLYFIFTVLLGIVEAQSRGGFLALLTMGVIGVTQVKTQKKRLMAALALIIFGGLFFARYAPPAYFYRMQEIYTPESDNTGSAQARASAMGLTYNYVISHPFSKYGLGNHSYYIANAYGIDTTQSDNIFRGSYLVHNIFLQFGADLGFIPLLFFILFILSLFMSLKENCKLYTSSFSKKAIEITTMSKSLITSLFGLLMASFFLAGAYQPFLYYIGGCCIALTFIAKDQKEFNG